MANASLDHMLSLVIFLAALILFIGLFGDNIQTAISYEQHTAISTKTSDYLDTLLLNPGLSIRMDDNWSKIDSLPIGFGLQDPSVGQYKLSPFSTMRLTSTTHSAVFYPRTGLTYNNLTDGHGSYLLTPTSKTVDYATASKLLGINGTYGFKLTLTPTVTVNIQKISTGSPLQFTVDVTGTGLVLSNANITYTLIVVNQDTNPYPSYTMIPGTTQTLEDGSLSAPLTFSGIDGENRAYALIVYSYIYGLKGMGCYVHQPDSSVSVVPLVDSFEEETVTLAHSESVGEASGSMYSPLTYSASYAILTEEYYLRHVTLEQPNANGTLDNTQKYTTIKVPNNAGILIVTYRDAPTGQTGITLAPWGLGPIAYPVILGGSDAGQDWVTTDIRQVTISGIAYQAQLSLWRLQGYGGSG